MKICITAQGPGPRDSFEERFGRAPYFIICDTETGKMDAVRNGLAGEAGGVGPKAAQVLQMHSVAALVTGMVGMHAQQTLDAAGISIFRGETGRTVEETFQAFSDKKLPRMAEG